MAELMKKGWAGYLAALVGLAVNENVIFGDRLLAG